MSELETQIAKLQFGNPKTTNAFAGLWAESASNGTSELFVVCELPMLNPAALPECERIGQAMISSLRRTYRSGSSSELFERALAELNEELGKLVAHGKSHWIHKLNALVAVKEGSLVSVAISGKMSALLYRSGGFASIAENSKPSNALKTFEDFSVGKLHPQDILIFSTTQLLSHISIDRVKKILDKNSLSLAGQEILDTLQDNAGPEVAFATLMLSVAPPGTHNIETADFTQLGQSQTKQITNSVAGVALVSLDRAKTMALEVYHKTKGVFTGKKVEKFKTTLLKNKDVVSALTNQAKSNFNLQTFSKFSRQKKFFFLASAILLIALLANVTLSWKYRASKTQTLANSQLITDAKSLLDNSSAALLYKDENQARTLYNQAEEKLAQIKKPSSEQTSQINELNKTAADISGKLNKEVTVSAQILATLSSSPTLISLPGFLATQTNGQIVSFSRTSEKTEDSALISPQTILASRYIKGDQAVIYNGERLFLWNFKNSTTGSGFDTNVPSQNNWAGLALYPTSSRVYLADKSKNAIISFAYSDREISKPVVSVSDPSIKDATDIAIDGNIYVLTKSGISKFQSGKPASFTTPELSPKLSGQGKIYTDSATTNLYVLDTANKAIYIMDKKGSLIRVIKSNDFISPSDFIVEESSKIIVVLDNSRLLKITLP